MSRQTDIAILRRYSTFAWSASLLVAFFGAVSLLLFVRPSLVGVQPGSGGIYQGNPIWLFFGAVLVIFGVAFQVTAYRWPRRLLRVLRTGPAKSMRLQVEVERSSDSTQYFALVSDDSLPSKRKGWRVRSVGTLRWHAGSGQSRADRDGLLRSPNGPSRRH